MNAALLVPALDRLAEALGQVGKRRAVARLEARSRRAIAAAFAEQGRLFMGRFARLRRQFAEADGPEGWETAWDIVDRRTTGTFTPRLAQAATSGLEAGWNAAAGEFGIDASFDLKNPRAVAYLERNGAASQKGISETGKSQIRTVVTQAADEGWSYQQTAQALRAVFTRWSQRRALTVATYEVGNAYEAGTHMVAIDLARSGLAMQKKWLTAGDGNVEPHCANNQAAGWIALDQPFPSGKMTPLDHTRCRCTCLYRRGPEGD